MDGGIGTANRGAGLHSPPDPLEVGRQLRARAAQMGGDALVHPVTPDRSLEQRRRALKKANQIRTLRKNLKAKVKREGTPATVGLLLDPPMDIATMKVFDLLLATKKFGKVKTNKYLVKLRISPSKTIGGLSLRQRTELIRALRNGL